MSEVKIVRLVTQEDIICKYDYQDGMHVMKTPCIIVITPQGYGAMPWMPFAKQDEGLKVSDDQVMMVVDPIEDMYNQYQSSFGSGIVVPEKQGVLSTTGAVSTEAPMGPIGIIGGD